MNVDCRCDKDEWYLRYWAIFLRLFNFNDDYFCVNYGFISDENLQRFEAKDLF